MAFGGRELPDDLTTEVLRCLPPRSLAVSRCVCRGWRDVVDTGRLLRVDLLPRSVGGMFIHYCQHYSPEFLARPTTGRRPSISGDLDFIPGFKYPTVVDHCNGLLLCTGTYDAHPETREWPPERDYIVNPATRRWARLPRRPRPAAMLGKRKRKRKSKSKRKELLGKRKRKSKSKRKEKEDSLCQIQIKWLVYDPTISPHYEVFSIHSLQDQNEEMSGLLLPSCPLQIQVYSSVNRHWEERLFLPEERVVQTIVLSDRDSKVYWRGALYLLCENEKKLEHRRSLTFPYKNNLFCENDDFVLRVSISDAKYRLVPVPADVGFSTTGESLSYGTLSLGISEKGVYCASAYGCRLRIFLLNESSTCGQTVWELKHSVDFTASLRKLHAVHGGHYQQNGPWMLQDVNYYKYYYGNDKRIRKVLEDRFEWNSDDDDVLSTEDAVEGNYTGYMSVLGFHPYKEVIFLNADLSRAVAYHWNTSIFQDLGNIFPMDYHDIGGQVGVIKTCFIYTPCWMDGGLDFPKSKL